MGTFYTHPEHALSSPSSETGKRHFSLETVYNVRDVGGYLAHDNRRTRWRTLLRGGRLDSLTQESFTMLLNYGLRTVIDLRSPAEIANRSALLLESPSIEYLHLPLSDNPPQFNKQANDIIGDYCKVIDDCHEQIYLVLSALLRPDAPTILIQCSAGKDRTGLIVALILFMLGVSRQTIAEDYCLSASHLAWSYYLRQKRKAHAKGYHVEWDRRAVEQHLSVTACAPEFITAVLDYIDQRYGGIIAYSHCMGLGPTELQRLKQTLLEAPSSALRKASDHGR